MLQASQLSATTPDGRLLFSDVSFTLKDSLTALIGKNGSGKTTLLRILASQVPCQSGSVIGAKRISLMEQFLPNQNSSNQMRIVDLLNLGDEYDAFLSIQSGSGSLDDYDMLNNWWDIDHHVKKILTNAGLPNFNPVMQATKLSGGEETRLRLAAALSQNPDILLLDEPTNHLDRWQRSSFLDLLDSLAIPKLVVSHDIDLLRRMSTILELENGTIITYGGNWEVYLSDKLAARERAEHSFQDAKRLLNERKRKAQTVEMRQQRRMKQGALSTVGEPKVLINYQKNRSEITLSQSKAVHENLIDDASNQLKVASQNRPDTNRIKIDINNQVVHRRCLIAVKDIVPDLDIAGIWNEPLSFELFSRDRIRLDGPNGIGKTTFIQIFLKTNTNYKGEIHYFTTSIIHLDQRLSFDSGTVWSHVRSSSSRTISDADLRTRLARFFFIGDDIYKDVDCLSGGERMRLAVAKCVGADQPDVLILDEPANHLDIDSTDILADTLSSYNGAIVVVSHNDNFIEKLRIHRTITLKRQLNL